MAGAVLKLTAGFVPFETCGYHDGVKVLFKENGAYALVNEDRFFKTSSTPFPVPSVVVIPSIRYVPRKSIVYSPLNVIYRDDMTCQYCGIRYKADDLEIDHVIPKSRFAGIASKNGIRFGKTSWENTVCSCTPCNRRKASSLCEEVGMFPLRTPKKPEFRPNLVMRISEAEKRGWMPYLEPFAKSYVRLIE